MRMPSFRGIRRCTARTCPGRGGAAARPRRSASWTRCSSTSASAARNPELFYQGEPVGPVDAVIPRIGASITFFGLAVVRQFEMMGVYCLNESQAIARSRDKLAACKSSAGTTSACRRRSTRGRPTTSRRASSAWTGRRWWSSCWKGRRASAWCWPRARWRPVSVIEAFHGLDQNILIQKFIHEAKGADIRALVVGRKVVAAMRRQAVAGRVPLEHPPRRHGQEGAPAAGVPADGRGRGARARVARGRRRPDRVGRGADGDGGQLLARPGRHPEDDRRGRGGGDHRTPGTRSHTRSGRGEKSRRTRTRVPTRAAAASIERSVQGHPRRQSEPIFQDRGVQPSKIQSRLQIAACQIQQARRCADQARLYRGPARKTGPAVP